METHYSRGFRPNLKTLFPFTRQKVSSRGQINSGSKRTGVLTATVQIVMMCCLVYSHLVTQNFFSHLRQGQVAFAQALENYHEISHFDLKISGGSWFDLGHLTSYFKARARFTTQRHFNSLKISFYS